MHWNGQNWRSEAAERRPHNHGVKNLDADIISEDMQLQGWGVTYEDLEPHFNCRERLIGCAGTTDNLNGEIRPGGNPFEALRSADYPLPTAAPRKPRRLKLPISGARGCRAIGSGDRGSECC